MECPSGLVQDDPTASTATSGTATLPGPSPSTLLVDNAMRRLAADLASGRWDELHGDLRQRNTLDVGVRIVTAAQSDA